MCKRKRIFLEEFFLIRWIDGFGLGMLGYRVHYDGWVIFLCFQLSIRHYSTLSIWLRDSCLLVIIAEGGGME